MVSTARDPARAEPLLKVRRTASDEHPKFRTDRVSSKSEGYHL
jgi:hypothetical protein